MIILSRFLWKKFNLIFEYNLGENTKCLNYILLLVKEIFEYINYLNNNRSKDVVLNITQFYNIDTVKHSLDNVQIQEKINPILFFNFKYAKTFLRCLNIHDIKQLIVFVPLFNPLLHSNIKFD